MFGPFIHTLTLVVFPLVQLVQSAKTAAIEIGLLERSRPLDLLSALVASRLGRSVLASGGL